ncbi:endonuclease 4-like [Senna tora]|uniref:Aspergillus nuclease S1 n=1 Tax=Senna tora TaxID=362788 RepID=A0A835CI37_9FABA|nr:endonuclease 4-like [Senna tora]
MQLKSAYAGNNFDSEYNLTEAHMFLSHFIGDVHQTDNIEFSYPVAQVRDNMIIESAMKTFYNSDLSIMIQSIQKNITIQNEHIAKSLVLYNRSCLNALFTVECVDLIK